MGELGVAAALVLGLWPRIAALLLVPLIAGTIAVKLPVACGSKWPSRTAHVRPVPAGSISK